MQSRKQHGQCEQEALREAALNPDLPGPECASLLACFGFVPPPQLHRFSKGVIPAALNEPPESSGLNFSEDRQLNTISATTPDSHVRLPHS